MTTLNIEVKETIEGVTGTTLSVGLTGVQVQDWNSVSDLFNDAVMSEEEYDRLQCIWNTDSSDTIEHMLQNLKNAGLIEGYELVASGN